MGVMGAHFMPYLDMDQVIDLVPPCFPSEFYVPGYGFYTWIWVYSWIWVLYLDMVHHHHHHHHHHQEDVENMIRVNTITAAQVL